MFKFTRLKQLQNLIEQIEVIAADEGKYSKISYIISTGSYTRIKRAEIYLENLIIFQSLHQMQINSH